MHSCCLKLYLLLLLICYRHQNNTKICRVCNVQYSDHSQLFLREQLLRIIHIIFLCFNPLLLMEKVVYYYFDQKQEQIHFQGILLINNFFL